MKLCFSTKYVKRASFLDTCRMASAYGLDGFEIYDALFERRQHADSVLRSEAAADAKRKLLNRALCVSALVYPVPLEDESATARSLVQYADMAAAAGVERIIVENLIPCDISVLREKLMPAIEKAEEAGLEILFETKGHLARTQNVVELLRGFSSGCLGVCWNIRESFFGAGESAETGIKTLGAYIRFVRLGDRKDGKDVLLGEGDLPVKAFLLALRSLNYDGFLSIDWNEEITDPDIVLTHFRYFISSARTVPARPALQYNRDRTGTFPWKKYEVIEKTFSGVLDTMCELYPDQYAFKYPTLDYTRTYAEFRRDVDETAAAFIALGVKPGYHVAVWATNTPEWFLSFFAAVKIGAVLVTVNTAYKSHEIEYLLRQSDTHTLVMTAGYKDTDYAAVMRELVPELGTHKKGRPFYSSALPFLRHIVTCGFEMEGCLTWEEMLEKGTAVPHEEVRRRASMVRPGDVANMQYTSGTTGFPKGVMLTHRNIINNGKIIGDRMDLSTADRMMVQVPMFHCFGMVLTMTSIMTHGGTLCPLPYFSPQSSLACIRQERITCFNGVPTMFIAMFNHKDFPSTDFSYMRTGIMAGANCPPDLMRRAATEMNMREILSVYGQTEASPGCTMGEVNEDLDHRVETVGSAFPGVECRIVSPETGEELPDGESGEFVARGFNIMKGYYKMPEATAQAIDKDGWLHSGDICCRTPDGYYKVTGRLKDMIIRGGENIYPREIEEFYLTHPKIKDVQVVGVKDEVFGEEVCAYIILHEGEQTDENELKAFGRAHMARHKVPRYFVFVPEFPLNAAGKVLKYKMKEAFEKELEARKGSNA